MKGTLLVIAVFFAGCIAGWAGIIDLAKFGETGKNLTMYILYILIFLVGVSMGCNPDLKRIFRSTTPGLLLLPVSVIAGTLLFSALASLVLPKWNVFDCLAVGSGLGYYSLSSVLISQYREAALGVQLAAELGTIALLTNIFREMFTLLAAPVLNRLFGPFGVIASAGVTAIDVCLPVILRNSGNKILPAAIVSGVVTDFSVPFRVPFVCSF